MVLFGIRTGRKRVSIMAILCYICSFHRNPIERLSLSLENNQTSGVYVLLAPPHGASMKFLLGRQSNIPFACRVINRRCHLLLQRSTQDTQAMIANVLVGYPVYPGASRAHTPTWFRGVGPNPPLSSPRSGESGIGASSMAFCRVHQSRASSSDGSYRASNPTAVSTNAFPVPRRRTCRSVVGI